MVSQIKVKCLTYHGLRNQGCSEVHSNTTNGERCSVTNDGEKQEHPTTATTVSQVAVANPCKTKQESSPCQLSLVRR